MNIYNAKKLLPPFLSGLLAWILYGLTNAGGLYWGDSGELITVSKTLSIGHSYGHPLFWLLGRVGALFFPDNPASGVNHMVALSAALTLFILALIVQNHIDTDRNLRDRLIITLTAAGLYAAGATIWAQATYAEVYHLHALMIACYLFGLDKYFLQQKSTAWLAFAAYFFGLAFTLGQYAAILLILIPLFARTGGRNLNIGIKYASVICLAFFLGLSIWIYLPVRSGLNPPVHLSLIDSIQSLADYLTRSEYANWRPAGWIAVPFGLKQSARILTENLSIFGVLLIFFWMITLPRSRDYQGLPWLSGSLIYAAICGILIPLTMTMMQMNEMDVYLIPALVLMVPVLAAGIQGLFRIIRAPVRPLLILPLILLLASNGSKSDISGNNPADRFIRYLRRSLPDSARVMPTTDNVIFPLWYFILVEGNLQGLQIEGNQLRDMTSKNSGDILGQTPLFIEMDGPFFNRMDILDGYSLAGPFAAFHADKETASRIDSSFVADFTFDVKGIQNFTRLDRLNLAKFWYNRARYFFTRWQILPDTLEDKALAWQKAIGAYKQTALLDDISSIGAETRARLALMHVNAGKTAEGLALADEAVRISPIVTEAYRAIVTAAYQRKDYQTAIKQLRRLIRLDSENGNVCMDLAYCYEKTGELDRARKSYQNGIAFGAQPRKSLEARLNMD